MRIRWTPAAAADLEHIKNYLTEHNPQFAQSTVLELYETILS
jgi:plasmid stabilization system protein ParE